MPDIQSHDPSSPSPDFQTWYHPSIRLSQMAAEAYCESQLTSVPQMVTMDQIQRHGTRVRARLQEHGAVAKASLPRGGRVLLHTSCRKHPPCSLPAEVEMIYGRPSDTSVSAEFTLLEKGPLHTSTRDKTATGMAIPHVSKEPGHFLHIMHQFREDRLEELPRPAQLFLAGKFPRPAPDVPLRSRPDLDEAQNRAYGLAMAGEACPISFIHGPPGTGKTHTICRIIEDAVKKGQRVLVLSHSNDAVDVPAKMLKDRRAPILRAGTDPSVVDSRLHKDRIRRGLRYPSKELRELLTAEITDARIARTGCRSASEYVREERKRIIREFYEKRFKVGVRLRHNLRNGGVVFSTFGANVHDDLLEQIELKAKKGNSKEKEILPPIEFDIVIVDEATKARMPELMLALTRAGKQIIFVGDPKQLGTIPLTPQERATLEQALVKAIDKSTEEESVLESIVTHIHNRIDEVYTGDRPQIPSWALKLDAEIGREKLLTRLRIASAAINTFENGHFAEIIEECPNP